MGDTNKLNFNTYYVLNECAIKRGKSSCDIIQIIFGKIKRKKLMAKHTVVAVAICVALLQVFSPSNAQDTIVLCAAAGKYLSYFPTPIDLLLPIGHASSTSECMCIGIHNEVFNM